MIFPFFISDSSSIAQTFSPTVRMTPEIAAPMANPSQFCLATFVEPIPGMIKGTFNLIPLSCPKAVSIVTFGKVALSLSASTPYAPAAVPMMLK